MNIIEKMRALLMDFPRIAELTDSLHIDGSDGGIGTFSLSPTGDTLVSESITGRQKRQHTFLLSAYFSGINDYERVSSSGVLLELAVWLSRQKNIPVQTVVDNIAHDGEITNIESANGMLLTVRDESAAEAYVYQLTIRADYTVEF